MRSLAIALDCMVLLGGAELWIIDVELNFDTAVGLCPPNSL
jgi:hypothetical protein